MHGVKDDRYLTACEHTHAHTHTHAYLHKHERTRAHTYTIHTITLTQNHANQLQKYQGSTSARSSCKITARAGRASQPATRQDADKNDENIPCKFPLRLSLGRLSSFLKRRKDPSVVLTFLLSFLVDSQ